VKWTPKPYQGPVIEAGMSMDRFNLHMDMGMGKTSTVLTLLVAKDLLRPVFPALVVGPKRVANSVWDREVAKWDHLKGLRVQKLIGPRADRELALATPADIYCINYENLMWLREQLKDDWPFRTTVSDESTRIKGHRCSWQTSKRGKQFARAGGSKNASALMMAAWRSDTYINLTGTPAPNGIKDLWGQQFPVDHGASLGNSFDAFSRRWFRPVHGSKPHEMRIEILPGAEDEVLSRIKSTTITVRTEDWFDIDLPHEITIDVDLPPKAEKLYKKMHRDSVVELQNETEVTAVNAGVLTSKCLQIASGHLYDEDRNAHHIHDAKLDALASLTEELNGAPLLVAYQFTADRDAILKKFKDAEILPSDHRQKDVEDRWNAGEIPMLVVHPKSAGHGLDLQYGGHNLCFYTPTWDLELYQQIIERIGPVRQVQAGFDRTVNVYRLKTVRTWDGVVLDRTKSKASVQDAVRDYLNRV
jgi:SNF2 family DNA or RNA helicase